MMTREELHAFLVENSDQVATAVIDALTAAGAETDWDSGTIESVLEPFSALVKRAGMPAVGSTSDSIDYANAWRRMDPHNWEELTE